MTAVCMVRSSVVADQRDAAPAHAPRQRMWRIHARAHDPRHGVRSSVPWSFSGNDRPGVMLAGAARTYLTRYAVKPAEAPVIQTSSDDGWRTLNALIAAQTPPVAIIDSRETIDPALVQAAKSAGVPLHAGSADRGGAGSGSDTRSPSARHPAPNRNSPVTGCSSAMAGTPNLALTSHLGDRPVYDEAIAAFVPGRTPPGMTVAGAAAGRFSLEQALADGARLGIEAASECGFAGGPPHPACDRGARRRRPCAALAGTAFRQGREERLCRSAERRHRRRYRACPSRGVFARWST